MKIKEKISDWLYDIVNPNWKIVNIYYFFKNLPYKIKRCKVLLPIIFNDMDYDFEVGSLEYLEAKLKLVRSVILKYQNHVFYKRDLRRIDITLGHIYRYRDLDSFRSEPEGYEDWLLDFRNRDNNHPKEKLYRKFIKDNYELEQYHWDRIWFMINKYSRSWWD